MAISLNPKTILARLRSERGQWIVLYTIAVPALLAASVLVYDVFNLYFTHRELQSAVDAAALAGDSYLPQCQIGNQVPIVPSCDQTALVAARQMYDSNRGGAGHWDAEVGGNYSYSTPLGNAAWLPPALQPGGVVPPTRMTITATVTLTPSPIAKAVGLSDFTVTSSGTAEEMPTVRAWSIIPVGVDYRTAQQWGSLQTLTYSSTPSCSGAACAGQFSLLGLGGNDQVTFTNTFINGFQAWVNAGDSEPLHNDAFALGETTAVSARIAAGLVSDPSGTFANHALNDPRAATLPMTALDQVSSGTGVPVVGFAEIWLVGVDPLTHNIQAYWIPSSVSGGAPPVANNVQSFGAFAPVMIR